MKLFVAKTVIRGLALIGLVAILPFAAFNPAVEHQWLVWLIGAIIALNIVSNEPEKPDNRQ